MAKPERLSPALLIVGNTTVPLAPSTLAVTGRTSTTVGLSWVAPLSNGGSALTDYTIERSSDGGATYTAFAHAASTVAAITVTGLVKGTAYLFRVAAVSAIGTGPVSDPVAQTTDAEPGAPTGLEVTAFTDTTVDLAWVAPVHDGGRAISDYLVEVSDDDGGSYTPFAHGASAATAISVTGLTGGTTYLFRVSAINVVGTGPASATVEQTTDGTDPLGALRAKMLAEYRMEEIVASANINDSVGARHLTQTGNPGVFAGTGRTFNGLTQWARRSTDLDDALGEVGTSAYAVSALFTTAPVVTDGTTRQIVSLREGGSGSGELTYILRRESDSLKLYIGDGNGTFTSMPIATLVGSTLYHVIFRVDQDGAAAAFAIDGGGSSEYSEAVHAATVANVPGNFFAVGGDTLELWDGIIWRVRVFNTLLSDAEMLLDAGDPQGGT